jgi:ATP-dependent Lhr-like helicase
VALQFLRDVQTMRWELVPVPVVSPFSFGLFASKIKEGLMLEDPEAAIERLWHVFESKTKTV